MTMVLTAWRRIRVMPLGCLPGAEPTWIDPSGVHAECAGQLLATRLSTTGTMLGYGNGRWIGVPEMVVEPRGAFERQSVFIYFSVAQQAFIADQNP